MIDELLEALETMRAICDNHGYERDKRKAEDLAARLRAEADTPTAWLVVCDPGDTVYPFRNEAIDDANTLEDNGATDVEVWELIRGRPVAR